MNAELIIAVWCVLMVAVVALLAYVNAGQTRRDAEKASRQAILRELNRRRFEDRGWR